MPAALLHGLRMAPFSTPPDAGCLELSPCYREALAAVLRRLEVRAGVIALLGEPGSGKSTLLQQLPQILPANMTAVTLPRPIGRTRDLLEDAVRALGTAGAVGDGHAGRGTATSERPPGIVALLIDDAHALTPRELGRLARLLAPRDATLRIVLAGQPPLEIRLADSALGKLGITRVRLRRLSAHEVKAYVRARLERAGGEEPDVFTPGALELIASVSDGVPGVVNALCEAALAAAVTRRSARVTSSIVFEVWRPVQASEPPRASAPAAAPRGVAGRRGTLAVPVALALGALVAGAIFGAGARREPERAVDADRPPLAEVEPAPPTPADPATPTEPTEARAPEDVPPRADGAIDLERVADPPRPPPAERQDGDELFGAGLRPPSPPVRAVSRHAHSSRPFARVNGGRWTVQILCTRDVDAAARERDRLVARGAAAFLEPSVIRGETWQRLLVGPYATREAAERAAGQLDDVRVAVITFPVRR